MDITELSTDWFKIVEEAGGVPVFSARVSGDTETHQSVQGLVSPAASPPRVCLQLHGDSLYLMHQCLPLLVD